MAGLDRQTGRLLDGWPHVVQSIMLIFTTGFGERMLRRWCGSAVPQLLGNSLTEATVVSFFAAIVTSLEIKERDTGLPREPRFRITKITPRKVDRTGELRIEISGVYMPRGHLGDFTPEDTRNITLTQSSTGLVGV
ncbi:GPW/gp25 family protein [Bradyrhizobium sp. HKCCYLRH3095]|uniref:GPW/gp25 family protein n=1 Tax=Bradyrhizobium sp. HKCCYLRH3095 TaxID=3420765 RepID=UPI003EBDEA4E